MGLELKRVDKNELCSLLQFDYGNVLGRLRFALGTDVSFFANVLIRKDDVLWTYSESQPLMSLSEVDESAKEPILSAFGKKISDLKTKIESDDMLSPFADSILSFPSDDYIFCRFNGMEFTFVLTGWGYRLTDDAKCTEPNGESGTCDDGNVDADDDSNDEEIETADGSNKTPESPAQFDVSAIIGGFDAPRHDDESISPESESSSQYTVQQQGNFSQDSTNNRMGFKDAVKVCFDKYASFQGRATRSEYWYFVLFSFLCTIGTFAAAFIISLLLLNTIGISPAMFLVFVYVIVVGFLFCPSISVLVRRLHDIGKSGWWYWIGLVPYVGGLVIFIFCCLESQNKDNEYGPRK